VGRSWFLQWLIASLRLFEYCASDINCCEIVEHGIGPIAITAWTENPSTLRCSEGRLMV